MSVYWAIPEIRGTPRKEDRHIKLKIWESQAQILTLKKWDSKNCFKKWEFPIFKVKNSKKIEIPIFLH